MEKQHTTQTEPVSAKTKALAKEIECILERNQDEKFLRKLLTRAIILEKVMH